MAYLNDYSNWCLDKEVEEKRQPEKQLDSYYSIAVYTKPSLH